MGDLHWEDNAHNIWLWKPEGLDLGVLRVSGTQHVEFKKISGLDSGRDRV